MPNRADNGVREVQVTLRRSKFNRPENSLPLSMSQLLPRSQLITRAAIKAWQNRAGNFICQIRFPIFTSRGFVIGWKSCCTNKKLNRVFSLSTVGRTICLLLILLLASAVSAVTQDNLEELQIFDDAITERDAEDKSIGKQRRRRRIAEAKFIFSISRNKSEQKRGAAGRSRGEQAEIH